jgi:hypothetical protein
MNQVRLLIGALGAMMAANALAAPNDKKIEKLADGVVIETPKKWKFQRFVNPATQMPDLKKMGIKGVDWRYDSGSMRIGITYMFMPGAGEGREKEAKSADEKINIAMGHYLSAAIEEKPVANSIANGGVSGVYGTLNAKPDASFPVFYGRSYDCVTSALLEKGDALFIISVGSSSCKSSEHQEAVAAIAAMHD